MGVIKIVTESEHEEFLRKKSREVTEITPRVITLLDDMIDTMRAANGCGLAAVQVGVLRRIVVIETPEGLFELTGEGLLAKAICHEVDHLDGILYTDKVIKMLGEDEV